MQQYLEGRRMLFFIVLFAVQDAQDHCLDEHHGTPSSLEKRNSSYDVDSSPVCDRYIVEGWYGARGYFMTTSPPSLTKCGTLYPVWFNGQSPNAGQSTVETACQVGFNDNCERSYSIEVKNCVDFLVYKLKPVDACNSAYCFEKITNESSTIYPTTTQPTPTKTTNMTSSGTISISQTTTDAISSEISTKTTEITSPPSDYITKITTEITSSTSSSTTKTTKDLTSPPNSSITETTKDVTSPPNSYIIETTKDVTSLPSSMTGKTTKGDIPPSSSYTTEATKNVISTEKRYTTQRAGHQISSSVKCDGFKHIEVLNNFSGDITSMIDGDNMTCFPLPLQNEHTPFFLAKIYVTEVFGIKAVPYDITITGNGLSCDRHSTEKMLQVSYKDVRQPTQFCSLLREEETSRLSVCKYHCACPNPVSCREVTIYLASGKSREKWSLCEVSAFNR